MQAKKEQMTNQTGGMQTLRFQVGLALLTGALAGIFAGIGNRLLMHWMVDVSKPNVSEITWGGTAVVFAAAFLPSLGLAVPFALLRRWMTGPGWRQGWKFGLGVGIVTVLGFQFNPDQLAQLGSVWRIGGLPGMLAYLLLSVLTGLLLGVLYDVLESMLSGDRGRRFVQGAFLVLAIPGLLGAGIVGAILFDWIRRFIGLFS